ncbi:hypothetical protein F5B22DRAFT_610443 [Xylaria bambusicola]|uniref:uncharacterized protein n=1 Tax=Xylaria bambusicola TaxID=326684 RepID=UPI002008B764|nr:uncharacterized protein F5B22DRAFT_610443 [Xylaria bambusicola]KAI0514690.1 hypothetical protein F5B22DRAFT_610443 [Xylaria bambusicola]
MTSYGVFKEVKFDCVQRKPVVIRVAPVPLYNSFDVWKCVGTPREAVWSSCEDSQLRRYIYLNG